VYHNLGGNEHARARHRTAERWARRGLRIRRKQADADPCEIAADEAAMAAILDGLERFDEAESLYRSALRIFERSPEAAAEIPAVLGNLGAHYALRGRSDHAVALLREAVRLKRRRLGDLDPDLAVSLNNLAIALRWQGDGPEADALMLEALRIYERTLGPDHPRTTACRRNARQV
jgi:Flp pilus assembly protein TadD